MGAQTYSFNPPAGVNIYATFTLEVRFPLWKTPVNVPPPPHFIHLPHRARCESGVLVSIHERAPPRPGFIHSNGCRDRGRHRAGEQGTHPRGRRMFGSPRCFCVNPARGTRPGPARKKPGSRSVTRPPSFAPKEKRRGVWRRAATYPGRCARPPAYTRAHARTTEENCWEPRLCGRHRMLCVLTVHLLGLLRRLHPLAQPSQRAHWHMQIQPSH